MIIMLSIETKQKARKKHVIPDPITTPRRGPLWLRGGHRGEEREVRGRRGHNRRPQMSRIPLLPRNSAKKSLNRLPVVLVQRPLDHIEASLGGLSRCLLQEKMSEMTLPCDVKTVKLPHLHPMMKYSPINNGLHGNAWQQKSHTRDQEGNNMGVSVTSKHPPLSPSTFNPSPTHQPTQPTGRSTLPLGHCTLNSTPPPSLLTRSPPPPSLTHEPSLQDIITTSYLSSIPPSPSSSLCPSIRGSSLAPPSLQAVVTHRRKPLTQQTTLRGHRIFL